MSSNYGDGGFSVTIKKEEVVAPSLPMQEHWLPMSNLDLLLPALDVGVIFCYNTNTKNVNSENEVSVMKTALAQALVSFYAMAGEVVENRLGEPELLCNNRGVDFIHAYADVELKDLDLHHPDGSLQGRLVPFKNHGVLAVQATELKCGGLVIGCTFDHRVADAHSANMFFVAWAQIANHFAAINKKNNNCANHKQIMSATIPQQQQLVPCFRRSLLNPRRPAHFDSSFDNIYVFLSSLPPPPPHKDIPHELLPDHLISRIYYVEAALINSLQSQAAGIDLIANGGSDRRISKLEAFSAFLWKIIASGGNDPAKRCKLGIVVDGRERVKDRAMQNYFGNVLSIPYSELSVKELQDMALSQVAEAVHACVEGATNKEHFLGLIDWVELHRPNQAIVKVYINGPNEEASVVVSSGRSFPVSAVDFGWGRPAFGTYHFPWGGQTGYVMPMPSTSKEGDWVVYMHLLKRHMTLVEGKASHLFKPLTSSYLNL